MFDEDTDIMNEIREAKKPKDDLRLLMNRKNFDRFELEDIMNDFS